MVEEETSDKVKKEETENEENGKNGEEKIPEIKDLKDIKEVELETKTESTVPKTEEVKGPVKTGDKVTEKIAKTAKTIEVDEYLVKFKNFSYLHCQWLTEQELIRGDKRISQKIKRFLQKRDKSGNILDFCDEEPFNPDYVEVDRVLDASEHTDELNVRKF